MASFDQLEFEMASFDELELKRSLRLLSEKAKFLRTFLLCARKWGNDDDVASENARLARDLVTIQRVATEIKWANNSTWQHKSFESLRFFAREADSLIDFWKEGINEWYIKFSDCSLQSSSSSQQDMSCDEIVKLIDSVLDTRDFLLRIRDLDEELEYVMDFLLDRIIFLKNFIRFTTLQAGSIISIADDDRRRHSGNLLTHIRAVAINAAHCSYMFQFPEMRFKVSVSASCYETYVQTLNASKLSRQPHTTATLEEDVNVLNDFITSLLSHLFQILKSNRTPVFSTKDQLQILHDGLRSLRYILENQPKNFDENMWDLAGVVVCDAGCVIFSLFLDSIEYGLAEEMNRMIFDLLERIKLITAKVARKSPQGSIFNFARVDELRFVDFLLQNLAELTNPEAGSAAIPELQIQTIYEGLVFLRPFLGKILELHDQKEKLQTLWTCVVELAYKVESLVDSLAIKDIANSTVMSFHSFNSIVEEIKLITAKVARKSPQGSIFNFASVDELRFVDFLLQNLAELANPEAGSAAIPEPQIQTIYEGLVFFRSFLGKILELHDEKEELQALWTCVVELAYKVESLVDSLAIRDIANSTVMSFDSFNSIVEEIKIIKLDALKIFDVEETKGAERCDDDFSLERSMPRIEDEIVGFREEATSIMNQLKRGGNPLQIIAIVGMPGSGKTTLAKKVYNDSSIISHFHVLAWYCMSQVYNKKNSLLEILTCIIHELPDEYYEMSEDDLVHKVYQRLMKKRYLIVLDNVWDIDAWNDLTASFPKDANGSRIILTSRDIDFGPKDEPHWETHVLRQLTDDESFNLLKRKLFPNADCPPALCELRKQILEKCKGLPLTIVILVGILATVEQDGWKEVVEHLSSGMVSVAEKCKDMLELSYRYLPDNLKPCFLYFGVFSRHKELTTKKLTRLWIAEGFVCKTQSKSLEDKAKDYLRHLIRRSLVMVDKQSSTGRIKTCRIHDLLHEFCVEKAREERFFQFLQGYNEISGLSEAYNVRRLYIHSNQGHLKKSRIFCPRLRSLVLIISEDGLEENFSEPLLYIGISNAIRVLDLSCLSRYPSEMGLLVQLRYLSLGTCSFRSIPSSIANLVNLETLIVYVFSKMNLPKSIWNLKQLRHLEIEGGPRAQFYLYDRDIDNSARLCNLDTISSISFHLNCAEKILKKFPNIRKLKAHIDSGGSHKKKDNVLVLDCLRQLESLNLSSDLALQVEFSCLLNLKKLTLSNIRLPWCKMSSIGNLPNLEVLKLHDRAFVGEIWNMEDAGQFRRLKFLKLKFLDIVKWTATESVQDHFPCLVTLVLGQCRHLEELPSCFPCLVTFVLDGCDQLEELPSCLGDLFSLEMIEISDCCESLATSARQIAEEQVSMGNEDLKVLIHS